MLTISDAITAGIEMIGNKDWRRDQHSARRNGWDKWHSEKHPELSLWTDLMPGHIAEFHKWLKDQYRPPTVNNYINPIRKAATWVKLYRPDLAKVELFIRNVIRSKHRPASKRYLMADQLALAVQAARGAGEPAVVAALMFGGLAGLDIGEIMGVTAADIHDDILLVRGSKNDYRPRIVPVASALASYANAWAKCFSAMPLKTDGALSHKTRLVLDGIKTDDTTFKMVTLHNSTRVTFTNMALHGGADLEYTRAYLGHAPESVISKHYADLTPREDDMPRVQTEKIEQLRLRVVAMLENKTSEVAFFR